MDLEKYTLVELRQMAKEKGAKNISKMKKTAVLQFQETMRFVKQKVSGLPSLIVTISGCQIN